MSYLSHEKRQKSISAVQLSKEIGVSFFPNCLAAAATISAGGWRTAIGIPFERSVEVDEGYLGGTERGPGRRGPDAQTKSVLAVAVELRGVRQAGQVKTPVLRFAALQVPPDAAADSLEYSLQSKVRLGRYIISDGWHGCSRAVASAFSPQAVAAI
jgi:hypothetical protein